MILQESINQTIRSFHSTISPTTLFSSTLSTASPVSSSSSSSTMIATELHHPQGHLILNVNSETTTGLVLDFSEWANTFTLGCLIFLFCLIVFIFSLLFILSFRRTETDIESKNVSTTTGMGNTTNTTIGLGNSRKRQPTFTIMPDDKNIMEKFIRTESQDNISNNATTPCAITSLEDDRRQADEVEKEREITLFITTARFAHSEHHNRYFRSTKYADESIREDMYTDLSSPEKYKSIARGSLILSPTPHYKRFRTFNGGRNFQSLNLTTMTTNHHSSLKRPLKELKKSSNELRKHQAMTTIYNIDLNEPESIVGNNEKYHNSYSEVIEELKNRFEILSTAA
ncbi:hypothetical protein DERP_006978 [Dermatophagoides pteronyssinus]|uniref:Uncharacterized protein n=1 Tax=Dermatophagoides pteronyssinus TaxID=6956 RepID=A0ABQ8JTT5_DERPT|nr:hypothetical protein DERP_006978 [Dermatophagoides pteronyssinus]